MSHGEETWRLLTSNSITDIGKCTRSNQINGNIGKIAKEQTLCISYRPLQHIGLIGLNLT